jgi:ABC-type Fe3+ transport system permease subunit
MASLAVIVGAAAGRSCRCCAWAFSTRRRSRFTLAGYTKVLTHPYYLGALVNTVIVGVGGMVGACLLGVPLAYFTARYAVTGRNVIATLAVMALVSPPFIGAYSWVVVAGNNGWLTQQMKSFGIALPTIYGIHGIILVFSLKFFPFVYLMTESALRNINRSFEEAAENLGCSPSERFFKITLPLVFPAISSGAILCFVLSIADFGTPSIIGRDFRTLSTHRLQPVHLRDGRPADHGGEHLDADDRDLDAGGVPAALPDRQAALCRRADQPGGPGAAAGRLLGVLVHACAMPSSRWPRCRSRW